MLLCDTHVRLFQACKLQKTNDWKSKQTRTTINDHRESRLIDAILNLWIDHVPWVMDSQDNHCNGGSWLYSLGFRQKNKSRITFPEGPSSPSSALSSCTFTHDSFDSVSFALVIFRLNDLLPPNNVRMKKKTLHKLLGILEDGIWEDLRNVCNHVIGDWCFLFSGNHGLQRARLGFWLDDWREGKPTRESASYLPGATQLSLIIFTTRLNPLNYSISKKNYGGQ